MYKSNITTEPYELITRLERKFQRKAKYRAERRQAREIHRALTDFRGIKLDLFYEDTPQLR